MISKARVLLTRGDRADATHVVAALDHADRANLELALVLDLPRLEVHQHRIVGLNIRVREPDGAAVVRDDVRVTTSTVHVLLNAAELVGSLIRVDLVNHEAA